MFSTGTLAETSRNPVVVIMTTSLSSSEENGQPLLHWQTGGKPTHQSALNFKKILHLNLVPLQFLHGSWLEESACWLPVMLTILHDAIPS